MAENTDQDNSDAATAVAPPSTNPASWESRLEEARKIAFSRWEEARRLNRPTATANYDPKQQQQNIAYQREIKDSTHALASVVNQAAKAGAGSGELGIFICNLRRILGSSFMECREYEEAKQQYEKAMKDWESLILLLAKKIDLEARERVRLECRRGIAKALCRTADRAKPMDQTVRLDALKLLMENINHGEHKSLKIDIRYCDDFVKRLVDGTYPLRGGEEDSFEACEANVQNLRGVPDLLQTATTGARPVLAVLQLRVMARVLEILLLDLDDLETAKSTHEAMEAIGSGPDLARLADTNEEDMVKYRRYARGLLRRGERLWTAAEKRKEKREMWLTRKKPTPEAELDVVQVQSKVEQPQHFPGQPLDKYNQGVTLLRRSKDEGHPLIYARPHGQKDG